MALRLRTLLLTHLSEFVFHSIIIINTNRTGFYSKFYSAFYFFHLFRTLWVLFLPQSNQRNIYIKHTYVCIISFSVSAYVCVRECDGAHAALPIRKNNLGRRRIE